MRTCKGCNFCKSLYMRHAWKYHKMRMYYCEVQQKIITQFAACEKYKYKIADYDTSEERLTGIQDDIKCIIALLEE